MKMLFTLSLLLIANNVFSQNQIYIGAKSYDATNTFVFTPSKRTFSDDGINIQVGKSQNGGLFLVSVASEYGRASINGSILVYLKNGNVVTLTRKINSDYSDDRITVIYSLSKKNIELLSESNIVSVRFNYVNPLGRSMGLSARNGQEYFTGMEIIKQKEIQTATEVSILLYQ